MSQASQKLLCINSSHIILHLKQACHSPSLLNSTAETAGKEYLKIRKYFTNLIKAGVHHLDQLPGVDSGINLHGTISLYNLHTKVQGILGRNQT